MTEKEFKKLLNELTRKVKPSLCKEGLRLFRCGGIDPQGYEDNHLLPKIVLTAALLNEVEQWRPRSPKDNRAVLNLGHF